MNWENLVPRDGSGSLIVLLVALVFGGPAILSSSTVRDKFSGLLFLPRARARWQREALEEDAAKESAVVEALTARIRTIQESAAEEQAWRQRKIDALRRELREIEEASAEQQQRLQRELEVAMSYIRFATSWAHKIVLWAEEHGYRLPPPPWQSFTEWQTVEGRKHGVQQLPREPPES